MAQWYKMSCRNCDYTNELILGSSVTAESLKDLNEDSADFKIFECTNDHELFTIDVHSSDFNNKCPVCGTAITEISIEEIGVHACPRCANKTLKIEPLSHL
jgi:formamidopyrimidine-DNA glycosylase